VRSAKCPSCARHIAYVRGADNLVYLVRDIDADLVRSEVDAKLDGLSGLVGQPAWGGRNAALQPYVPRAIRGHIGVRGWVRPADESSPECRALHGRVLDSASAPDLPLRACRRQYCFCEYAPTLGDEPPR
jgi:hypothetical protein